MISCMTVMFNYFKGSIKTFIIGLALIIFGLITMIVGIYDMKSIAESIQENFAWLVYATAVWFYQLRIMQNVNSELIGNMQEKI